MSYEETMRKRYENFQNSGQFDLGSPDLEETPAPAAPAAPAKELSANEKGIQQGVKTAAQGGGAMDIITQGLMASGTPQGMAAGLGLSAASAIVQGRNQRAKDRYDAEVKKINARQEAINKMAQLGQGLRA